MHTLEIMAQFDVSLELVKSKLKERTEDLQRLDTTQAEFYHLLENGDFPDVATKEIFKEFKKCLLERREVKMELAKLQSLDANIKNNGLKARVISGDKGCNPYRPKYIAHLFKKYGKYIKYDIEIGE